jgi:hypothetical protein
MSPCAAWRNAWHFIANALPCANADGGDLQQTTSPTPTSSICARATRTIWCLLAREIDAKEIAELGGGANPLVANSELWGFADHRTVIDISAVEQEKAQTTVETRVADLCQPISSDQNAKRT